MIRAIVALAALAVVAVLFWQVAVLGAPDDLGVVAGHYARHGVEEDRGANIVTSVVVNYRGLDTLGEVTVLFLSVTGAAFVLSCRGRVLPEGRPASEIVHTGARLLAGPIMLFGAYVFSHGHLTPGGGFQGGAVIASGALLLLLADREHPLPHGSMAWLESLSGLGFVMVGLVGLFAAGSFLANRGALPLGSWNRLFSAGIIPIISVLIGLKVGTELALLLDIMVRGERGASTTGGGPR